LAGVDDRPFPPGDYDVVVVGSGPGGLQVGYSLARAGVERWAHLSRDPDPGGMFRRFPVFQRLISWTKPDAPFERGTREYEWYDHNSLLGDEPSHQAIAPEFMDRAFDLPARHEMESALAEFARRGNVAVRYGCEWLSTRREDDGFVLETSDGEYRCRACVFAIGVTEAWTPPIPGLAEADAPHYTDTLSPERYAGKTVFIVGKRNSGFEVAQGLLPWARKIVLASPRPVDMTTLAFSPLRLRYLQPFDEHVRGGSGSYVVDASLERIERHGTGYRIRANGTSWDGELLFDSDEIVIATGFRAPLRDLPDIGVATVSDGRLPAQTPYWESVSVPGIYFAGNVTSASPGMRKHGATSNSTSVNGFRYNARVLARHIAETRFGRMVERPRIERDDLVSFLLAELARAPELWIQKGYLARVVTVDPDAGIRDDGISPLAEFVDGDGADACAIAVEYGADGTIAPVVYVRRAGALTEHLLPPHPLFTFDTQEHRTELAARLEALIGS
jgi:thioredoxin reductase